VINIRPARREDTEAIASLFEELDQFYGATQVEPLATRLAGIEAALFMSPPAAFALLAWADSSLVGLASYSFLWPAAGVTRSLYLKELYVADRYRRKSVGSLLMQEIFNAARAQNCSRVEWSTEVENVDARQFYSAIGAALQDGKLLFRVTV
jgi:GNAT superfamily N-acetyltransferase